MFQRFKYALAIIAGCILLCSIRLYNQSVSYGYTPERDYWRLQYYYRDTDIWGNTKVYRVVKSFWGDNNVKVQLPGENGFKPCDDPEIQKWANELK